MGNKWNGLNRDKPPLKISKKRMRLLNIENQTKKAIRYFANSKCSICGLEPTAPTYSLEIHEVKFRSAGGKVSFDNSVPICSLCHYLLQHFIYRFKGQCLRIIIQWRKTGYDEALLIYNKILDFAKKRGLLIESKLRHEKES